MLQQAVAPQGGAFRAGRGVAAGGEAAGIAQAHGDDGDAAAVVECLFVDPHPFAQAIAGRVGKGDAGLMRFGAGRLTGDQDARRGCDVQYGARFKRERWRACTAGAHLCQQGFEACIGLADHSCAYGVAGGWFRGRVSAPSAVCAGIFGKCPKALSKTIPYRARALCVGVRGAGRNRSCFSHSFSEVEHDGGGGPDALEFVEGVDGEAEAHAGVAGDAAQTDVARAELYAEPGRRP